MARPKSTTQAARRTPAAPKPAPAKAPGLTEAELLLAAMVLANGDDVTAPAVIPWAAYGEAVGNRDRILGVDVETGATGMEVSIRWDLSDADDDSAADNAPDGLAPIQDQLTDWTPGAYGDDHSPASSFA